jgi:hypothetical protein
MDRFRDYAQQSKATASAKHAKSNSDWQTKKLGTSFRAENWARMKKARDDKLQEAEVMANNKIQFEVSARLQKERDRADKEARHEMAQIRVDALRQKKLTQSLAETSEREALANQRLQADMAAKVRTFSPTATLQLLFPLLLLCNSFFPFLFSDDDV